MNTEIHVFLTNLLGYASNLRRLAGQLGIMEQWAEENGIKTYSMHTDSKGKQYLFDKETGKTIKVRKPRPKYMKVIK